MLNLQENSLEWAIKHINEYNDTYVFPLPFEFEAINEHWVEIKEYLRNLNVLEEGLRTYRTEITPKSKVGFRISTQLDPLDSIIFNALIYELAQEIENERIPKEDNIVFSYRLAPKDDGTLYDMDYNWDAYSKESKRLCDDNGFTHVVVTDIADFFPSIYLHNIETYFRECVKKSGKIAHANVIINAVKAMHSSQTHKGLPIGPQFSRPIAEIVLHQVDRILLENDIVFVRYVDDYRLFCKSEAEAYQCLSFLAQKLYDLLNLKLNEQKTHILESQVYLEEYTILFKDNEKSRILRDFYDLCEKIGISRNPYEDLDFDSLTENQKKELEQINILELFKAELNKDKQDYGFIKFLLSNLARFDNTEVAELILNHNMEKIFPVLQSFVQYLERVQSFDESQKHLIGKLILEQFDKNYITQLQFNRAWLLHLFTKNEDWNNKDKFMILLKQYKDDMSQRELLLAIGRSNEINYFRENRMANVNLLTPWVRRAFIAGISCLPKDERTAWYKTRNLMQREYLDKIIEKWAAKNNF